MRLYTRLGLILVLVISAGSARAQMLDEKPVPKGGDPVGAWEAEETPLSVYAAKEILDAFSPEFSGSVSGQLSLASTGAYEADYAVTARVKIASLLLAVDTSFVQTLQETGTYEIDGADLILTPAGALPGTAVSDTVGFTVAGDSLHLVQKVPLGGFDALVTGLFPDAGPPLAVLGLRRTDGGVVDPGDLTADFDGDGDVDFGDFLGFAGHYGKSTGDAGYEAMYDLNGNGTVDFLDFLQLAKQYGRKT
jgi:hypothetical protein